MLLCIKFMAINIIRLCNITDYVPYYCVLIYDSAVWDSSVNIATRYRLDSLGIKAQKGQDIPYPSRPTLGPTQPPIEWVPGLFRG